MADVPILDVFVQSVPFSQIILAANYASMWQLKRIPAYSKIKIESIQLNCFSINVMCLCHRPAATHASGITLARAEWKHTIKCKLYIIKLIPWCGFNAVISPQESDYDHLHNLSFALATDSNIPDLLITLNCGHSHLFIMHSLLLILAHKEWGSQVQHFEN